MAIISEISFVICVLSPLSDLTQPGEERTPKH